MKTMLHIAIKAATKVLTCENRRAVKTRSLIKIHLALQGLLFITAIQKMQLLFFLTLIFFLLVTVQIIVYGVKLMK